LTPPRKSLGQWRRFGDGVRRDAVAVGAVTACPLICAEVGMGAAVREPISGEMWYSEMGLRPWSHMDS